MSMIPESALGRAPKVLAVILKAIAIDSPNAP